MKKGVDYTGISVVYLCHDGAGKYVLAKRNANCRDEHNLWDCGGGGLEFGDTVENTLRKEIAEEYCADVLAFEFLGYRDVHRVQNGVKTHWLALDFRVQVDPTKVKIGEPHKFDDIGWFALADFPKDLHSQLPTFLKNYRERL